MSPYDNFAAMQALAPGDVCEWCFPARREFNPGTVMRNGGSGYWTVRDAEGVEHSGLYAEFVRAPGKPWVASA